MSGGSEQETPPTNDWKAEVAAILRNLITRTMLWGVLAAAALLLLVAVYDVLFRRGCVSFGFFQSTHCKPEPAPIALDLTDAVVAFDKPCPQDAGWVAFGPAAARFIVGAGKPTD